MAQEALNATPPTDATDSSAPRAGVHVVLLNQAFWPDVVATAQMAKDLAEELAKAGYDVSAVASRSIYGQSGATLPRREALRAASAKPGDSHAASTPRAIDIYRVGLSLFGRGSTLQRLLDFALFYVLAMVRVLTLPKPHVIVGFSTPPYIALVGLLARLLRGSKAVYWAMDLYPDVIVQSGMIRKDGPITRALGWLHRQLVARSDATVVLGRCMQDRVASQLHARAQAARALTKVHFIPVWSDESGTRAIAPCDNPLRREWGVGDAFCVMYSGNFGHGHDAQTLMGAMLALRAPSPSQASIAGQAAHAIRFVFVGGGKRRAEIETFIAQHELNAAQAPDEAPRDQAHADCGTNATPARPYASYHDYVARERLSESLSVGDCHIISLLEGMEGLIVPSKLWGVMAVERPAIFIGNPSSEVARIILEHRCGVVVRQGDVDGLVNAIRQLASDPAEARRMGQRGRDALLQHYSKQASCAKWARLLGAIATPTA